MEKRYILDYQVSYGSSPEGLRAEFQANDDEGAVEQAKRILVDVQRELLFAPPPVRGTLFRLEVVQTW